MSEPMRFSIKHHGQLSCVEHCPDGEYVLHSDYARLKAEVERSTAQYNGIIDTQLKVIDELKAEVERLEKQVNNLITSLQKSHDEHGKALYKLKYKK